MKNIILLIVLSFTFGLNAQDITKLYLSKTEWFAKNDNKSFFKNDTIRLMRVSNFESENLELNRKYISLHKNQSNDFIELSFKKNNKLNVKNFNVEKWITSNVKGNWSYKFDSESQILIFYHNNELHSNFKLISDKSESMKWATKKNGITEESIVELKKLDFVRLKNY
jgi:hypothetical protein